jgi:hypothetical protein
LQKKINDDLALGTKQRIFRILNDAVQIGELLSFERARLQGRLYGYVAVGCI